MTLIQKVINLLKTHSEKKRQIEILRYELSHLPRVNEQEFIESLSLRGPLPGSQHGAGIISDKTMTIAMQYRDVALRLNNESALQITRELRALEEETDRLDHFVSLLSERQAMVIRKYYFEGRSWSEIEAESSISKRSLTNERNHALTALTSMYQFLDSINDAGEEESKTDK